MSLYHLRLSPNDQPPEMVDIVIVRPHAMLQLPPTHTFGYNLSQVAQDEPSTFSWLSDAIDCLLGLFRIIRPLE